MARAVIRNYASSAMIGENKILRQIFGDLRRDANLSRCLISRQPTAKPKMTELTHFTAAKGQAVPHTT